MRLHGGAHHVLNLLLALFERLRFDLSDGKRRDQLLPWQTVTFAASNDSIIELFLDKGFDATKLEHMQLCLIKPIMLY